jgi:signal transduction histidine kinase
LLVAADAERRTIERELHENVQQQLVALAVNLQLASALMQSDPRAAKTLLAEMQRDVQVALEDASALAQRIYPTLDGVGFAATLRSAAARAGAHASVDVDVEASTPREPLEAIYRCWLAVLRDSTDGACAAVTVRNGEDGLAFELVGAGDDVTAALEALRDHVEALGGRLTSRPEPEGTHVSGSLPLDG